MSPQDVCALAASARALRRVRALLGQRLGLPADSSLLRLAATLLRRFWAQEFGRCAAADGDVHRRVKVPRLVYELLKTLGFCAFEGPQGRQLLYDAAGTPVCLGYRDWFRTAPNSEKSEEIARRMQARHAEDLRKHRQLETDREHRQANEFAASRAEIKRRYGTELRRRAEILNEHDPSRALRWDSDANIRLWLEGKNKWLGSNRAALFRSYEAGAHRGTPATASAVAQNGRAPAPRTSQAQAGMISQLFEPPNSIQALRLNEHQQPLPLAAALSQVMRSQGVSFRQPPPPTQVSPPAMAAVVPKATEREYLQQRSGRQLLDQLGVDDLSRRVPLPPRSQYGSAANTISPRGGFPGGTQALPHSVPSTTPTHISAQQCTQQEFKKMMATCTLDLHKRRVPNENVLSERNACLSKLRQSCGPSLDSAIANMADLWRLIPTTPIASPTTPIQSQDSSSHPPHQSATSHLAQTPEDKRAQQRAAAEHRRALSSAPNPTSAAESVQASSPAGPAMSFGPSQSAHLSSSTHAGCESSLKKQLDEALCNAHYESLITYEHKDRTTCVDHLKTECEQGKTEAFDAYVLHTLGPQRCRDIRDGETKMQCFITALTEVRKKQCDHETNSCRAQCLRGKACHQP